MIRIIRLLAVSAILIGATTGLAEDWPQFHGPNRDNKSTETDLLKAWPEGGPTLLWRASGIGEGYTSVAVVGDRIFTAGDVDGDTVITALDLDGEVVWRGKNGPAYKRSYPGARATPTYVDGRLYHLNGEGDIACLDAADGHEIWSMNMPERFDGRTTRWGLAASLLVDGDLVFCTPGGEDVFMAGLDRRTGETVWACAGTGDETSDMPGYAAPILVEYGGLRQIVTMTSGSAVGVDAATGKRLWRYEHPAPYEVNATTPIFHDGGLALFGTWGRGATMLRLHVDGEACRAEEVWRTPELDNEHGGVILVDGCLYGHADGNHKDRHWACLDWETGETRFSGDGVPMKKSGSLTYADGMLYLLGDDREVGLAPASPDGIVPTGRFTLPEGGKGPTWAHPVVSGGRLYIRHGDFLYAYDVKRP